jgi:serine/threonine protein kinase
MVDNESGQIKLIDFGDAQVIDADNKAMYSSESKQLGCILYKLLFGRNHSHLFALATLPLLEALASVRQDQSVGVSDDALRILSGLLRYNNASQISVTQLGLSHFMS